MTRSRNEVKINPFLVWFKVTAVLLKPTISMPDPAGILAAFTNLAAVHYEWRAAQLRIFSENPKKWGFYHSTADPKVAR